MEQVGLQNNFSLIVEFSFSEVQKYKFSWHYFKNVNIVTPDCLKLLIAYGHLKDEVWTA